MEQIDTGSIQGSNDQQTLALLKLTLNVFLVDGYVSSMSHL